MEREHQNNQPGSDPETIGRVDPSIYVASLADYNNGHLHGDWINAAQDPEDIQTSIDHILKTSDQPMAEEWAIHDYEGFGAFQIGEYEALGLVALIANGIEQHGQAFSHWANIVGTQDTDRLHRFDDHYRGVWHSLADYAQDMLDDMGVSVESFTPGWLQAYVTLDLVALGNDLATDFETAEDSDGTHVFEAEI